MTTATIAAQYNARWIAGWLAVCAVTILGMILLGGVTRLTESGLSMVDWRPIMGVIPPLTEAQWLETFAAYQQYPEYQKLNQGMDLSGFKQIFWFEYLHRVLGRLIGLMYFVPLVVFAFRRMITPQLLPTLIVLLILGAAQGVTSSSGSESESGCSSRAPAGSSLAFLYRFRPQQHRVRDFQVRPRSQLQTPKLASMCAKVIANHISRLLASAARSGRAEGSQAA